MTKSVRKQTIVNDRLQYFSLSLMFLVGELCSDVALHNRMVKYQQWLSIQREIFRFEVF